MKILGVKIDNLSQKEILEKIESFLVDDSWHQIATINPEFILRAQKEEEFRNILNRCDLNVADGIGIRFAFWRFGKFLQCRMAGADLMLEILRLADEKKLGVFLVASDRGLSSYEETRAAILKKFPNLKIGGINLSPVIARREATKQSLNNTPCKIKNEIATLPTVARNDIVFCNFGAPEQEKFIHSLKNEKNAKIRLAMGVGGSFDYLTGNVCRAPVLMRKIGLEWLWRLILEPRYRFKRILSAVLIFPIKVIFYAKGESAFDGNNH